MNILFTINKSYYPVLLNCLHSIARHDHGEKLEIYILHQGITNDEALELNTIFTNFPITFYLIEIEDSSLCDFPDNHRYPKLMYTRLFAHEYLPEQMERILYLDPDTIILKPLNDLYYKDFQGNLFIGCSHIGEIMTKINQKRLAAEKNSNYVNTGVLVINLKQTRKQVKREIVLEYIADRGILLYLPDQDVLSALYGNQTLLVDSLIYNLSEPILAMENLKINTEFISNKWIENNTVIIHYTGKNKPWHSNYIGVLGKYYQEIVSAAIQ